MFFIRDVYLNIFLHNIHLEPFSAFGYHQTAGHNQTIDYLGYIINHNLIQFISCLLWPFLIFLLLFTAGEIFGIWLLHNDNVVFKVFYIITLLAFYYIFDHFRVTWGNYALLIIVPAFVVLAFLDSLSAQSSVHESMKGWCYFGLGIIILIGLVARNKDPDIADIFVATMCLLEFVNSTIFNFFKYDLRFKFLKLYVSKWIKQKIP